MEHGTNIVDLQDFFHYFLIFILQEIQMQSKIIYLYLKIVLHKLRLS